MRKSGGGSLPRLAATFLGAHHGVLVIENYIRPLITDQTSTSALTTTSHQLQDAGKSMIMGQSPGDRN